MLLLYRFPIREGERETGVFLRKDGELLYLCGGGGEWTSDEIISSKA
jgi:hypothetical protein